MNSGMLWFDNSDKTLAKKIGEAFAYYQKKYGRAANMCLINPAVLKDQETPQMDGLTVRANRIVLPGHIWIGIEDMPVAEDEA